MVANSIRINECMVKYFQTKNLLSTLTQLFHSILLVGTVSLELHVFFSFTCI